MWKLIVGFALFAALALFILTKSGGNIDLSGESHGIAAHEPAASEAVTTAATAASAALPASAASQ